ncbi:5-hydroxytryptamine receptor 2B-like [Cottoperca gobio]|uniref:5-hydroxytryptamine receptor 2B-like n=1 Tax=Cottoperca gobio TaxID=56716 RepID=A0A6J2PV07_COTGO|nr:5-hydroxytryptamine receptor 2B-like [Cottoperca gobio]
MRGELTPAWDRGNITVWEEYSDIAFVVANSLILFITSAVGIAANLFVILAVYHQKSLQNVNNALVVNLAVIDFLRCVIDCPILLTIVINAYQRRHIDGFICDTQVASFSFSCCIQLLTLACISAERYQAIARPFTTSQRRRRIMVLIPLTWTLAILVAVFCVILVKDSPMHARCNGLLREAASSYDTFGIYMLVPLWAACFSVIIGFYARIFILVRSHNRKIFDKGSLPVSKKENTEDVQKKEETTAVGKGHGKSEQNETPSEGVAQGKLVIQAQHNASKKDSTAALLASTKAPQTERPRPPAMQVAVQTEGKPFKTEQPNPRGTELEAKPSNGDASAGVKRSTTKPQKVSNNFDTEKQPKERVNIDKVPSEMKESRHHVHSSAQLENPESASVLLIELKQAKSSDGGEPPTVSTVDQASSFPPVSSNVPETEAMKQNVEVEGAVCMMPSKLSKERASKKKESKMAKRAGYIILTFLLFWLPLITTILMNFVLHRNNDTQMTIIQNVEILSVSVACITSLSDPIIYAVVNPQFRTEFYRLKNNFVSVFNKK